MPNLDDQTLDTASSDVSAVDEKVVSANVVTPDDAASSPATGANEAAQPDMLSVVRDVVKESRSDPAVASPAEGEVVADPEVGAEKRDEDDWSDVPFNKHPRFQKLLHERNSFKVDAERYNNVVDFLDQANLTDTEAADGLRIMGLAKTNPAAAWEQIKPWVQKVLVAAGEIIPDELTQRVAAGELSRDAALEIARANAKAQSYEAARTFEQQRAEQRQMQEFTSSIISAADSWENDRVLKDPNFNAKRPALQKEILYLQMVEGKPNTPEGVKAQLNKAYRAVNASLPVAPAAPVRQPVRPVTGGQVAGNQSDAPRSTLDIVRANRRSR